MACHVAKSAQACVQVWALVYGHDQESPGEEEAREGQASERNQTQGQRKHNYDPIPCLDNTR